MPNSNMKTTLSIRCFALIATLVCWLLSPVASANALNLTGLFVFGADGSGHANPYLVWDTRAAAENYWDLFITSGDPGGAPDGLTAPFLNGPTDAQAGINLTLSPGTNRFTIFAEQAGADPFYGINLFFNDQPLSGISALAMPRTS